MEVVGQAACLGEVEGDGAVAGSGLHPQPAAELLLGHPSPPPARSKAEGRQARQLGEQQVSSSPRRLTKKAAGEQQNSTTRRGREEEEAEEEKATRGP